MKFYYINTDWNARDDVVTCDLWFDNGMAFTGDYKDNKWKHSNIFNKISAGDVFFMYHSHKDKKKHGKKGYVGVGMVLENWDHRCYEESQRLLYLEEMYEYRITVKWFKDWRSEPKTADELGLPVTSATWCNIDESRYGVRELYDSIYNPQQDR